MRNRSVTNGSVRSTIFQCCAVLICGLIALPGCAEEEASRPSEESTSPQSGEDDSLFIDDNLEVPDFEVPAPTFTEPVTAAAQCRIVANGTPYQLVDVWAKLQMAPGHYVYGQVADESPFQALAVDVALPEGTEFVAGWVYPPAAAKDGHPVFYRSIVLHRRLRFHTPISQPLAVKVHYQTCNEDACFPPDTIELLATIVDP